MIDTPCVPNIFRSIDERTFIMSRVFSCLANVGLRIKILTVLLLLGLLGCGGFSIYTYKQNVHEAVEAAKNEADMSLQRSTQMFIVSTKKFHDEFQNAKSDPAEQKRILNDWCRTIFAVDEAVINDFGADKPRVRLTGDTDVYGYKPLGTKTTLTTAFEREAAARLAKGEKRIEQIADGYLRVSVPLPAQAHPGCAECHFAKNEGLQANYAKDQLLGSLNAYIPLDAKFQAAKSKALSSSVILTAMILGLLTVLYLFMNRSVIHPIRRCMESVLALSKRDFSKKCPEQSDDEIGRMSAAINQSIDATQNAIETIEDKAFYYESILNAIPQPLSVTDKDMNWTFVNKSALDINGLTMDQVRGKHCSNWGADICNTEHCGVCMAKKAGGKARSFFTQPAFPGMYFISDAALMYDRHGNLSGHVEVVQDITAIEQLRRYSDGEVNRLTKNLTGLGNGELDYDANLAPATEYTKELRDNFEKIDRALEKSVSAVRRLVDDARTLAKEAVAGNLDKRADAGQHAGQYRAIVMDINRMLDAVADPLRGAGDTLQAMANKDFTIFMQGDYSGEFNRLKENVNSVVTSVRTAISEIVESSIQFDEGARVIAQSAQALSNGSQTQSASVEEMTASVDELARSIETVKNNAAEADKVAASTNLLAEKGGEAVNQSIESMELIRTSSQQISEIIRVISEIAGQTNLLALNAAIEAARAGEHGMGFAVVADEVRKLAERSNQAAREISTLIKESTQRVEEGAKLSAVTGDSLKKIIEGVEATASKIAEIATVTIQQAANAQEVSKSIQQVAQVTEQAAAGSEEMASSSEELGAQATALKELVSQFETN
jgi:PAS domain S-box-containing protein